ncbi:MAG: sulfatase-like hydrolase/transferase [Caldisericaceae bacterium]|nr:sulfatase-like hydrolase/transferase [Caldisericaceae bacterium]
MKEIIIIILISLSSVVFAQKPNILLILTDDLGYADVGFNGSPDIKTPNLDSLAHNGTIFSDAYVAHPFCGPSRMALSTGRYPHPMGVPYNLPDVHKGIEEWNVKGVPVSETLIGAVLKNAGYYTACVGKWHMGAVNPKYHPNNRGYDDFYGFLGGGHKYFPEEFVDKKKNGDKWLNEYVWPIEHNGKNIKVTEYLTDAFSHAAINFIRKADTLGKPFFMYLAYNAPHTPLEATQEDLAQYSHITDKKRRTYAAMVSAVDRGVGEIVRVLKELNQFDNTLIIFLSDNGGKLTAGANNTPLRGGKGDTWEGGVRTPMFFHWPGHIPSEHVYKYPVTAIDFYPTFAALAGAKIPDGKILDGKNIWDYIIHDRPAHKGEMIYTIRHRLYWHDMGARRDQWKITRIGKNGDRQNPWGLYNVYDDPGETKNLRDRYPDVFQNMLDEMQKWTETHKDSMPRWFWSKQEEQYWKEWKMPRYWQTFNEDCTLTLTDIPKKSHGSIIKDFHLKQNYPNPFNPKTKITFKLSERVHISLDIFNLKGERVANIINGLCSRGVHNVIWDGRNCSGKKVSSGIYIYRLYIKEKKRMISRKMVVLN